jgi:hypothetical protein
MFSRRVTCKRDKRVRKQKRTVREEDKLRVFENRVLRRIFGPKRDGVTGGLEKAA